MKRHTKNSGFTLIEMIAVLVIVGVLAAVAGMGIVKAAQAFAFNNEATALAQKAELTMERLRRSLENLTNITSASSSSIALQRLRGESIISESYSLSGNNLIVNSSEDGAGSNTLTDLVSSFSMAYKLADNTEWTHGTHLLEDLARIEVSLVMSGPSGSSMTFANHVVPRNTYVPNVQRRYYPAGSTSSSSPGCFVATAAFGGDSDSRVFALSQFRDKYLTKFGLGRSFLDYYSKAGPGMAQTLHSHYWLKILVRIILLPVAGFAFLALYFPWGLVFIAAMAWLLARLVVAARNERRKKGVVQAGASGAVLLSLVIAMVVMAAIGAGMVSMYSASNTSSSAAPFTARAHYIAESGLRYAGWALDNNTDDDSYISTDLHEKTFAVDDDSFYLEILTYWYDTGSTTSPSGSLTVSPWGGLPDKMKSSTVDAAGYIIVDKSGGGSEMVGYSGLSVNQENETLTFNLTSTPSGAYDSDGRVLPGAQIGSSSTIYAKNIGNSAGDILKIDLDSIVGKNDTFLFPKMRGIITLTDDSNRDWYIMYDKVDYVTDKLVGIRNCPGRSPLPESGISVSSGTPVQLERYAMFSSEGTAGSGIFQAAETIKRSQSMGAVSMYRGVEGGINFNEPGDIAKMDPVLGEAGYADGAMQVTETEQTYSYTDPDIYQQESLIAVDWQSDLIDSLDLEEIYERTSSLLSYDLQVKVKFTGAEDDLSNDPVNIPGNYMPGLSFRTACSGGVCNYYGMSFLRGMKGIAITDWSSSWGCEVPLEGYEEDDIPDNLYQDHGTSHSIPTSCLDDSVDGSGWNDVPPQDAIPYLMFWQKAVNLETGGALCSTSDYATPFDWISFMKLTDEEERTIYKYEAVNVYNDGTNHTVDWPEGWYDGIIPNDPRNSNDATCDGEPCSNKRTAYPGILRLTDKYGVLETTEVDGVFVLGVPGDLIIRDPSTVDGDFATLGKPVAGAAYVVGPNTESDEYKAAKVLYNYRVYIKEWATVMVRIIELEGHFNCNADDDELNRINLVAGYVASPDSVGASPSSSIKDGNRSAYVRNSPVKWPEDEEYFTLATWTGYSSKEIEISGGCSFLDWNMGYARLATKGKDADGDDVVVYSGTFVTDGYDFTDDIEHVEFGLHTLGIDATNVGGNPIETCYFDDLYWAFWEGGASGIMPGVQQQ